MGSSSSLPMCMSEDLLEDYIQLTYLSRNDILKLLKKFISMTPHNKQMDLNRRYSMSLIMEAFPQLKYNPFRDRIFKVFSSLQDDRFSFEDMMDLCSVMSENCPDQVKAKWAFQIFDFNGDGVIDLKDITEITDRLTQGIEASRVISDKDKQHVVDILLNAVDIQKNGSINEMAFEHAVGKMPDFPSSFSFRL